MEPVISKGLGQEFANIKAKYSGTFHWDRMLQPFEARVAAILDCVPHCLRKRLVKEQTTICFDRQVAVAALGASGTKSLLVADCIKKRTALPEVNQVTIIWVPKHSSIQ